jgi:hypothetical protein
MIVFPAFGFWSLVILAIVFSHSNLLFAAALFVMGLFYALVKLVDARDAWHERKAARGPSAWARWKAEAPPIDGWRTPLWTGRRSKPINRSAPVRLPIRIDPHF